MTVEVYQDIVIGAFHFSRSNGVSIRKSTNTIGSSATIKVPISAVIENKGERGGLVEVSKAIKVGDAVTIMLGYKGKVKSWENIEFRGFVKRINATIPLEIECEDNNYLLRKKPINKSWKTITLKEVLTEIVSGTGITLGGSIPEVTLSPFYLKNCDGAFALQKIADEYGLTIYFKTDGSLYAGLAYTESAGTVKLVLNGEDQNVIDADDLKFRAKEDVKLKVKAISILGDNTRIETEIGDNDGAQRTLNFYNIKTIDELKNIAKQEIDRFKYDGYEGTLKCFFIPIVELAYKADIVDSLFPDRDGSYYVESITIDAGEGGYRRNIEIGIKL